MARSCERGAAGSRKALVAKGTAEYKGGLDSCPAQANHRPETNLACGCGNASLAAGAADTEAAQSSLDMTNADAFTIDLVRWPALANPRGHASVSTFESLVNLSRYRIERRMPTPIASGAHGGTSP